MASTETISVDIKSAIDGLDDLDKKIERKYVSRALRAAARPTLKLAQSLAPDASGRTKRAIKMRSGKNTKSYRRIVVGLSKKWANEAIFTGAFIALGHKIGRRQLGSGRKQVPANTFLEQALKQTATESISIFSETIADLIEKHED